MAIEATIELLQFMLDCFEVSVQRLAPESSPVPTDILAEIKELFHLRYR